MNLVLAVIIAILNLLDYLYTSYAIPMGIEEANPIADFLMETGDGCFGTAKLVVIPLLLAFVVIFPTGKFTRYCLYFLLLLYLAVVVNHVYHTNLL